MDISTVLVIIIAAIINLLLLMVIISSATQTHKRIKQNEINLRLLTSIARKLNVTEDEINQAWNV